MTNFHTTRLAPSPTGALHLGNARTFLANWLLAEQNSWRMIFRMEDLDTPRTREGAAQQAIDELSWLGLTWQGEITTQSDRDEVYRDALERLIEVDKAYLCQCTRKDIESAASAPAEEDRVGMRMAIYPGTCRDKKLSPADGDELAWRVHVEDRPIIIDDKMAGRVEFNLARTCGDFVVYRKSGLAAYQLAVVVDDAAAGVDVIVRGDDLLESAAMQNHLRSLLGYEGDIEYYHLPLVIGPDGRKLAKRHGDTRLSHYINNGASVNRMLGLLGYWLGAIDSQRETDVAELLENFSLAKIPRDQIVFTKADDDYLMGKE